jgi:hypothetical protein
LAAYTFLWAGDTWDQRSDASAQQAFPHVDYVAGDARRPLSQVKDGDEIFVVNIKGGRLRLGGRLVADGGPLTEDAAARKLSRDRLIGKALYVFGKKELLDRFRPALYLEQDEAFGLELIDTNGERKELTREQDDQGAIYRQEFRQPMLLTKASAEVLRRKLGIISPKADDTKTAELLEDLAELERTVPDITERDTLAKARIGQGRFKADVISKWGLGEVCAVTGVAVPEMLVASHIKPWRDSTNLERLDPMNGLLLVAHLDKLFDRTLLSFGEARGEFFSVLHPRVRSGCSKAGILEGMRLNTAQLGFADAGRLARYMAGHHAQFLTAAALTAAASIPTKA